MGRAVADVAIQNDKSRAASLLFENVQRALDTFDVVGIANPQDTPAISQEARRCVLRKGDIGVPFDGDPIDAIDPAEVVEPQVSGQGSCLRTNALHHAAISANSVNLVVENRKSRTVIGLQMRPAGMERSTSRATRRDRLTGKTRAWVYIQSTGQGFTPQIPDAYSVMVRSLENFPEAATFRIALRAQASGSAYSSPNRPCA